MQVVGSDGSVYTRLDGGGSGTAALSGNMRASTSSATAELSSRSSPQPLVDRGEVAHLAFSHHDSKSVI